MSDASADPGSSTTPAPGDSHNIYFRCRRVFVCSIPLGSRGGEGGGGLAKSWLDLDFLFRFSFVALQHRQRVSVRASHLRDGDLELYLYLLYSTSKLTIMVRVLEGPHTLCTSPSTFNATSQSPKQGVFCRVIACNRG